VFVVVKGVADVALDGVPDAASSTVPSTTFCHRRQTGWRVDRARNVSVVADTSSLADVHSLAPSPNTTLPTHTAYIHFTVVWPIIFHNFMIQRSAQHTETSDSFVYETIFCWCVCGERHVTHNWPFCAVGLYKCHKLTGCECN